MYSPLYTKRVKKQIEKLPHKEQIKILNKIEAILENPRKISIKLEGTKPVISRLTQIS